MLDRQEHAVEVDGLLLLPIGQRHGLDRHRDADARIGDHDVETAEALLRLGDHVGPRRLFTDVVVPVARLAAGLDDALDDLLAQQVVDVGHEHGRPFTRQRFGTGLADSGSATGDDGDLARDLVHQRFFQLPGRFSA